MRIAPEKPLITEESGSQFGCSAIGWNGRGAVRFGGKSTNHACVRVLSTLNYQFDMPYNI